MIFDERIAVFAQKVKIIGALPPKTRELLEKIVPCCELNVFNEIESTLDEMGLSAEMKERGQDLIVEIVVEYILAAAPKSVDAFDEWHEGSCERIASFLKGVCDKVTDRGAFGHGQYWLNLTIKYLYLFIEDFHVTDDSMDYFKYSHVPLVDVILAWYSVKTGNFALTDTFPWEDRCAYLDVQNLLRKNFATPIAEEYKIWWEYKRRERMIGSLLV